MCQRYTCRIRFIMLGGIIQVQMPWFIAMRNDQRVIPSHSHQLQGSISHNGLSGWFMGFMGFIGFIVNGWLSNCRGYMING